MAFLTRVMGIDGIMKSMEGMDMSAIADGIPKFLDEVTNTIRSIENRISRIEKALDIKEDDENEN